MTVTEIAQLSPPAVLAPRRKRRNSEVRIALPATIQRQSHIHGNRYVSPLAKELHHFLARPCQLRPP